MKYLIIAYNMRDFIRMEIQLGLQKRCIFVDREEKIIGYNKSSNIVIFLSAIAWKNKNHRDLMKQIQFRELEHKVFEELKS